jgi:hypothetical protein
LSVDREHPGFVKGGIVEDQDRTPEEEGDFTGHALDPGFEDPGFEKKDDDVEAHSLRDPGFEDPGFEKKDDDDDVEAHALRDPGFEDPGFERGESKDPGFE